jgi:hypothetical protein
LTRTSTQPEKQLRDAFDAFRSALEVMLQDEARASVEKAVDRLAADSDQFTVADVQVEVTVLGLTLQSKDVGGAAQTRPRQATHRATAKAHQPARRNRRPAARGGVREAILAAFVDDPAQEMTVSELGSAVESLGITTTTNNLHQQLRRLVQAGELDRAGRGQYRRPAATSA